jgi:hypothetical protein
MRKPLWILFTALFTLMVTPNVYAGSVTTYTIHFEGYGPLPTGSFVYDDTTNQFLSFTVQWDGLTFDFMHGIYPPNDPSIVAGGSPCLLGATGPLATLALMTVCGGGNAAFYNVFFIPECEVSFFFLSNDGNVALEDSLYRPSGEPGGCVGNPMAAGPFVARPRSTRRPSPTTVNPGQIIRIIAGPVYVPPGVPVEVNLGFVDVNGTIIGPQLTETLTQGQTASLDLNADALGLPGRTLVRPVATVVNPNGPPAAAAGSPPSIFIPEVTEVFDAATGFGRVLIPGDTEFAAQPTFAFQGLAFGETMQVIVSAFPNTGCSATLGFADINGNPIGSTKQVDLQPGQSDSLELHAATLGLAPGQRKEIQPLVRLVVSSSSTAVPANSACQATTEVFDTVTGRTWTYQAGGPESTAE